MFKKLSLLFLLSPPLLIAKADLSKDKTLYVVAYAHLDTQWLWTYQVTIDEFIKRTLEDNFALFERYPQYNFNFTGSIRYAMMEEYFPQHYAQLKAYIQQNRWFVSGSSVDEGDVNVPSPEAIFRQILLGNNYFRREFNRESVDYMLPDCFGFPASMPSIWAHAGLKGFSTQKLTWGSAVGIPFNLGLWEGPDGKTIVAALNPGEYVGQVHQPLNTDPQWVERVNDNGLKYGVYTDYHYYGVGDQGGAPREQDVKQVMASLKPGGPITVLSAASDQLFRDLSDEQKALLPRYKGDMLLTEHSAGTLTSQAYMKRWNRRNEQLADSAERAAVVASVLAKAAYPQEKINRSWLRVLGSQMHDILPGTSLPKAYEYSYNDELIALNGFAASLLYSVGAVASRLETRVPLPLLVYNPLAIPRQDVVEAHFTREELPSQPLIAEDAQGRAWPVQVSSLETGASVVVFAPELAPLSFEVFSLRTAREGERTVSPLGVTATSLTNGLLAVQLNPEGDVASIRDLENGERELLAQPAQLVFQYEQPQAFPAWNMDWADRQKPPYAHVSGPAKIEILEQGPVRVSLQVSRKTLDSTFVQRFSLVRGSRVVWVGNAIDWLSKNSSLKASFPLTIANPLATYNWGLGTIERNNNHPRKFEVPSHQWFDLSLGDGSYGVSILEDGKFGSDKPSDNEVRLTLLYTPNTERGGYHYEASQDWGHHDFTYGIFPHRGDWRSDLTYEQGERLNQKPQAFRSERHPGDLGRSFSFAQLSTPQVGIRALKKAESGSATIIRLQELWGMANASLTVSFAAPIAQAWEVDAQERKIGEAVYADKQLLTELGTYSPRSFAVEFVVDEKPPVLVVSTAVDLPFNGQFTSRDGEARVGSFPGDGANYPAEQFPSELTSEGVRFVLAAGKQQGVIAAGQVLALPAGSYNRLYLLAAASSDTEVAFSIDDEIYQRTIQQWYGKIGDYDNRIFTLQDQVIRIEPGFIKRAPIAWFATHRHLASGKNDSYTFSYLFKYVLPLKPGASQLTLPRNPQLAIFAVSVAADPTAELEPAWPLYDDFSGRQVLQPQSPALCDEAGGC